MMNTELKLNRQPDGRYIVTVDGGSIECQTLGAALDILRSETGDVPGSQRWQELESENARLKKALDSAAKDFEQLREALEKEKAEKNKWILEAYDWKDTVTKLARLMTRSVK
jgi:signal transduction protein with GAF and PtsI domain